MASNPQIGYYESAKRRKIALLVLLLLLIALLAYATYYFTQNKALPIPAAASDAVLQPPSYLYSIAPRDVAASMPQPTGIVVSSDNRVYVTVPQLHVVRVFTTAGKYLFSFSKISDGDKVLLKNPVHLALSPKGEVYVTDRDNQAVYIFSHDGQYLRRFAAVGADPKWMPLAIAFDKDGYVYISDVHDSTKHQVYVFDPSGKKTAVFGKTKAIREMTQDTGSFYFPNGFAIDGRGRLFVADGDNRRVQVFDRTGKFLRLVKSSGVPRGLATDSQDRLYVVDALGHLIDIYSPEGERLTQFGGPGIGPGQFQYPNDISIDSAGRIYVVDRDNNQVQVWGWPKAALPPVTLPTEPAQYAWLLLPLALLALMPLTRKRTMVLLPDFAEAMVAAEAVDTMQNRRWRWVTPEGEHASLVGLVHGGVKLDEFVRPMEHSVSDANDLRDRLGIEEKAAASLALGRRARILFTEDEELRRIGALLGIDVYNREQFMERFGRRK